MEITPELLPTADGSQTLKHPILGELYHSDRGAVGEALHVYIKNGLNTVLKEKLSILEIGFGSGLNAFLTLERTKGTKIEYHAIELYPISIDVVEKMSLSSEHDFLQLHKAPWGVKTDITEDFTLTKWADDLLEIEFFTNFDLVYFDCFAPDSQPLLWSEEVFKKIADAMPKGGVLVTYSAKGEVKRALRAAGFEVKRLEGALGKRHQLRAVKL